MRVKGSFAVSAVTASIGIASSSIRRHQRNIRVVVDIKQSSSLTTGHSKPGNTVIVWEHFVPTSVEPLPCEIARNMTRV